MGSRIVIIQGHPDRDTSHFGHVLTESYRQGAEAAGREVRSIHVADLDFPLLRSKEEWEKGEPVECIRQAQADISWAEHLVISYPLWLGTMPAMLKAFLEQIARPGFAVNVESNGMWEKLLAGRSARIIVTMGMPASVYRWVFGAHSLKNLERNILHFVGIRPVRETLVGMVENMSDARRQRWFDKLSALGRDGL